MTNDAGDKKTLGIIGGMGPLATVDLFQKIIFLTDADTDAAHIHILIDNNPKVPDRTKAVLSGSDAPFPYIRDAAQRLEMMGADILLLPCNTSHVFYARLIAAVGVPVINMVEETAKHVALNKQKRVGVLATSGTIYAGLYQSALKSFGIEAILPSQSGQQAVMSVIYDGVKAGADIFDITGIGQELSRMADGGAESFILGCTELPIAFEKYGIDYPTVDPAMILAHAAIVRAGYFVKS